MRDEVGWLLVCTNNAKFHAGGTAMNQLCQVHNYTAKCVFGPTFVFAQPAECQNVKVVPQPLSTLQLRLRGPSGIGLPLRFRKSFLIFVFVFRFVFTLKTAPRGGGGWSFLIKFLIHPETIQNVDYRLY